MSMDYVGLYVVDEDAEEVIKETIEEYDPDTALAFSIEEEGELVAHTIEDFSKAYSRLERGKEVEIFLRKFGGDRYKLRQLINQIHEKYGQEYGAQWYNANAIASRTFKAYGWGQGDDIATIIEFICIRVAASMCVSKVVEMHPENIT